MLHKQSTTDTKAEEKTNYIFINNMNTWFSNFVIEELRTEIHQSKKKITQNKFQGTINANLPACLPRLFSPKLIKLDYAYHYDNEIFKNNIFIFNLDDTDLNELEYVIRGLKIHAKDKEEKVLILVSNIMTWAKTPLKTNKTNDNDEIASDLSLIVNNDFDNNLNNELEEEKNNSIIKQDNDTKDEEHKNNEKDNSIAKKTEKNISLSSRNNQKYYYFNETDYNFRIPATRYHNYKLLENLALNASNVNIHLKTFVVCPGFTYGCGEDFFYEFFRTAWYQSSSELPLIEDYNKLIPMIHIIDLARILKYIVYNYNNIADKYLFAVDKTKDKSLKSIITSISKSVGNGKVKIIKYNNPEIETFPNINELSIDIKVKTSPIFNVKYNQLNKNSLEWYCENGIVDNLDKIKKEFKEYRNLSSIKILITGPPGSGKTTLGKKIAEYYNIPYFSIADIINYIKSPDFYNFNSENKELYNIVINKHNEILDKLYEEAEIANKNKKGKDKQPVDKSSIVVRLPDDVIFKIVKSKLSDNICNNIGYVLDGFPRNICDVKGVFFNEDPKYTKLKEEEQLNNTQTDKVKDTKEISKKEDKNKLKEAANQQLLSKEKYKEEYGHLIVDKDIIPDYVLNICNISDETIKTRLKDAYNAENNTDENNNNNIYNEDRINRRLNTFKTTNQYSVANLFLEYYVEVIDLDCQELNSLDNISQKAVNKINKLVST